MEKDTIEVNCLTLFTHLMYMKGIMDNL